MVVRFDREPDIIGSNQSIAVVDEVELDGGIHRRAAVLVGDDVLMTPDHHRCAGHAEEAQRDLVRHRARRYEQRGLLAEAVREHGFQLIHRGVLATAVVADLGLGHGAAHGGCGPRHRVGSEIDEIAHGRGTLPPGAYRGGVAAVDLEELLGLARRLGTAAGELVREGLTTRRQIDTKSTTTDLVTEMDRGSEALVVEGLRSVRPGDGIVGEEGSEARTSTGVSWFIDPIDGTTNYVYGLPGFGVSIGASDEAGPAIGVVVDPMHHETFTAIRGRGAFRNGHPIRASSCSDVRLALVATGFSYESERRALQADVLRRVLPAVRDIRRLGAASVDLCHVASGRVDAYYERGLHDWDKAAGMLIAREAGALVDDRESTLVVAAAPGVFDALRDLIVRAGADHA